LPASTSTFSRLVVLTRVRLHAAGLSFAATQGPRPPKNPATGCPTMDRRGVEAADGRSVASCGAWRRRSNRRKQRQKKLIDGLAEATDGTSGGGGGQPTAQPSGASPAAVKGSGRDHVRARATTPRAWGGAKLSFVATL
jgi:hypothetical protein